MRKADHRAILLQALNGCFSEAALQILMAANFRQDHLLHGQVGHPEYHFDDNAFTAGWAYVEEKSGQIRPALQAGDAPSAWRAFGRLTHAVQDFYSHSNYVALWLDRFPAGEWPSPQEIDPLDESLLHSPELRSGRIYLPLEPLSWIPGLSRLVLPLLPRDSHAWMNLDAPGRGPKYPYAFSAAVKRTRYEYEQTATSLPADLFALFCSPHLALPQGG